MGKKKKHTLRETEGKKKEIFKNQKLSGKKSEIECIWANIIELFFFS